MTGSCSSVKHSNIGNAVDDPVDVLVNVLVDDPVTKPLLLRAALSVATAPCCVGATIHMAS